MWVGGGVVNWDSFKFRKGCLVIRNIRDIRVVVMLVLFSLTGQCVLSQQPEIQNVETKKENSPIKTGVQADVFGGLEELQRMLLQELQKRKIKQNEHRRQLFSKLSTSIQKQLTTTQEIYGDFLENIGVDIGLSKTIEALKNDLEKSDSYVFRQIPGNEKILMLLEKVRIALLNGTFYSFLGEQAGNPFQAMMQSGQLIELFSGDSGGLLPPHKPKVDNVTQNDEQRLTQVTPEELDALSKGLGEIACEMRKVMLTDDHKKLCERVELLESILTTVQEKNFKKFTVLYLSYLEPAFIKAKQNVLTTRLALEKELASQSKNSDKEIKEALEYWMRELRSTYRTLLVFSSLKSHSESLTSGSDTLFKVVAYAYDIWGGFFDLYKNQKKYYQRVNDPKGDGLWKASVFDGALRAAMASWYFFNKRADTSNSMLFSAVSGMGSMSLKMLPPQYLILYNVAFASLSMGVLYQPSFWEKQPPKSLKSIGKIVTSFVYYHLFYCNLFQERPMADNGLWPNQYPSLKAAVFEAVNEGQKFVFDEVHGKIRRNVDPFVLQKFENYSMGIVKPELVGYLAQTFMPLLLLQSKSVLDPFAAFTEDDVFDPWFKGNVQHQFIKRYVASGKLSPADFLHQFGNREQVDIGKYYVECRLLSYFFSSVGKFWGGTIARKYQHSLVSALTTGARKTADALVWMGLMDKDTATYFADLKSDFSDGVEDMVILLKEFLHEVFRPGSPIRNVVVSFLANRGDVRCDDKVDPMMVNREIFYFSLNMLARVGLVTYLDAATLVQTFETQQPFGTDEAIEKLVDAARSNVISVAGGYAGSWIGSVIGSTVMWKYGPFYPKIFGQDTPTPGVPVAA